MKRIVFALLFLALFVSLTLLAGHIFRRGEEQLSEDLTALQEALWAYSWTEASYHLGRLEENWVHLESWNSLFIDQAMLNEMEEYVNRALLTAAAENRDECLIACDGIRTVLGNMYRNESWHWSALF